MKRRKLISNLMMILSGLLAFYGIAWLSWIFFTLFINGVRYINVDFFTQDPVPAGMEGGGAKNALVGHFIITALATMMGVPIGVMAGVYFSEYGKNSPLFRVLRHVTDIMVSAPSIVVGAVVYALMVKPMGHFSALAGSVALALIMLPVIAITTDEMLKLVPLQMREAAYALGAYRYHVIWKVVLRAAKRGVMTGILLGIARVAGETAPLLFTAFYNDSTSLSLLQPMASLTVMMYNYVMGPYEEWHQQAWTLALVLTVGVLFLFLLSRILLHTRFTSPIYYIIKSLLRRNGL